VLAFHGKHALRVGRVAKMKMLDKTEQSDRQNPNEKPDSCYCSALPKGSGLCLPCYTRWLASAPAAVQVFHSGADTSQRTLLTTPQDA
jgi:hypothetical protein